jgi:CBS domain-containing membrane protein
MKLRIGGYYSNGDFGNRWAVRQVVRIAAGPAGDEQVRYKVVVGPGRRQEGSCEHSEFTGWAKYEVTRNESSWERV